MNFPWSVFDPCFRAKIDDAMMKKPMMTEYDGNDDDDDDDDDDLTRELKIHE